MKIGFAGLERCVYHRNICLQRLNLISEMVFHQFRANERYGQGI